MRILVMPGVLAALAGIAAYAWGGPSAALLLGILIVLETTLSFDNAVVNAKVLARMDERWQRRFLTWGIPAAVFGTRFVLPVLIVSAAVLIDPVTVLKLALFDPAQYAVHLESAHAAIAAFGSAFLFLVSFKYFFDTSKTVHWLGWIERAFSRWGGIEAIEIALVLAILLACSLFVPEHAATVLASGLIGTVLFVAIQGVAQSFERRSGVTENESHISTVEHAQYAARAGLALFVYLNVLDSAFSLDGVVGAFAITANVPVIVAGLGIGALFVRSLTLMLVRAHTLETLVYLEHGAHWAILGLAIAMLLGIFIHVPEAITGTVGLFFVGLAYYSSRCEAERGVR